MLTNVYFSPSMGLLKWMKDEEWKLSPNTFVLQNPLQLPKLDTPKITLSGLRMAPIREIVFFGRLETRKVGPFSFHSED